MAQFSATSAEMMFSRVHMEIDEDCKERLLVHHRIPDSSSKQTDDTALPYIYMYMYIMYM